LPRERPAPETRKDRTVPVHIPTPFAISQAGSQEHHPLTLEYERKRAALDAVLERLLLLPPRHAHAPPFAREYEALAEQRRALGAEVAALEQELGRKPRGEP